MTVSRAAACVLVAAIALAARSAPSLPEADALTFRDEPAGLLLRSAGRTLARYVYRDPEILRPYFCDVREPGGVQVTRTHPPVEGRDRTDHASMHPGIWLGFGDLAGSDFWRNKGRVEHVRFTVPPGTAGREGSFAVENRYRFPSGAILLRENAGYRIRLRPDGYLLLVDSRFTASGEPVEFGDQEEMGLGVRVATPISVAQGGRILNSEGFKNEKGVWGKTAAWCDYSGMIDQRRVGVSIMSDPANFAPSWFHARDYGLLVANPFGRKAFTGGDERRVRVTSDPPLRLRFGVFVYGTDGREADLAAAYRDYTDLLGAAPPAR